LVTDLDDFARGTLTAFARAVDANSTWTAGHSERVTEGAVALGRHLGLSEPELDVLQRGGLLHDIGKIGVSASILDKPSRLTDEERAAIEMHPVIGHRILSPIPPMRDVLEIVRHHHERMDGTGYPDRLAGESIPLLARVLAVADVYDALVSDRPYRAGMRQDEALSLIRVMAGAHLDPVIVTHFLALKAEEALQGYRQTAGGFSPQELSPAPVGADA
jgi:putative nucleotidyltransferase with HDIG domain